ncbi:MAG: hypothetical protein K2L30_02095 [Duncaniella sp.]|nr:hypothetical protein [Duncaniella sp.]
MEGKEKPPTFALAFEKQATAEAAGRESRKIFFKKNLADSQKVANFAKPFANTAQGGLKKKREHIERITIENNGSSTRVMKMISESIPKVTINYGSESEPLRGLPQGSL